MNTVLSFIFVLVSIASAEKESLTITGSSTMAPVVSDLAKLYEKENQGVRIDVQTGGSSRGILDARNGLSEIGMVSRSLREREKDLHRFPVAKDGLALIVHSSNTTSELSREQVVGIYTGKIKNWKTVGGQDQRVVVVNKAEGRSSLELFLKFFSIKNSQIDADIVIGDNEQGIKTVASNRHAVGYVSVGSAEFNVSRGTSIRVLSFDGVEASVRNVENGTYPLARELNLITRIRPSGLVEKFINYVQSSRSSKTIREHYLVPIHSD